jgi:threonine dehydrogenase-like Zn-dependent dehydrogenase
MKALTILPGQPYSAELRDVPEPSSAEGDILCEMKMVGVCGTDFEITEGHYGEAPAGSDFLILGHESLGKVIEAPAQSPFRAGDLIVGFVRRPDPVPCPNCATGEWDMCRNGLFKEHGIKQLHGYASDRYRLNAEYALKLAPQLESVGVLLEPTSVVAKAWEQTLKIYSRSVVEPKVALITGAGPVGLLAAMIGVQKGFEVHVLDQMKDGIKPKLVQELGAFYHWDYADFEKDHLEFDVTLECTGAPALIFSLFNSIKPDGVLCLAGVSPSGRNFATDIGKLNLNIVLQNEVIFGSVNANRRHYAQAADFLGKANLAWLQKMITRQIPLANWQKAFKRESDDIKVVLVP